MEHEVYQDSMALINGPEDGNVYSLAKPPCYIGSDAMCGVQITLDRLVRPRHAMLTAVRGGYRVRCMSGAPAFVDGRRVGRIRSQILRPDAELKIGATLLILKCAKDGLAARFRGVDLHNDLSWTLRLFVSAIQQSLARAIAILGGAISSLLRHWKIVVPAALILGYLYVPAVRHRVLYAVYYLQSALARLHN